jgi:hypothetical protein
MAQGRPGDQAEVFRPFRILPVLMAFAGLVWASAFVYLMTFDGVPARLVLGTLFFVGFFSLALTYYARSAIFVGPQGITYRGMVRTRWFSWRDIRKLEVVPGPITVYAIRTPDAFCHFTSFFRDHKRLATLLVERAGLPEPG